MLLSIEDIVKIGQIATLFEVSAYPKPGNVHRTHDFDNMTYEDFLISSVCMGKHLKNVTSNANKYYPNNLNQINIGKNILNCIKDTNNLVHTNTNLGISLLFMPIAASYGAMLHEGSFKNLSDTLDLVMKNTTTSDSIAFIEAINISQAGGIDEKVEKYDVNSNETIKQINDDNINLYDLMVISSEYDKLAYELTNKLPVISKIGKPACSARIDDYSQNDVTLDTYLTILSSVPDTLITRKYGMDVAEDISDRASKILTQTYIASDERLKELKEFDKYLNKHKYNPGTTADFTAATLFVTLIDKYSTNA